MQIRMIKHLCKVCACLGGESAPVTADKPAQLIEKSMANPSVLAMLVFRVEAERFLDRLLWYLINTQVVSVQVGRMTFFCEPPRIVPPFLG